MSQKPKAEISPLADEKVPDFTRREWLELYASAARLRGGLVFENGKPLNDVIADSLERRKQKEVDETEASFNLEWLSGALSKLPPVTYTKEELGAVASLINDDGQYDNRVCARVIVDNTGTSGQRDTDIAASYLNRIVVKAKLKEREYHGGLIDVNKVVKSERLANIIGKKVLPNPNELGGGVVALLLYEDVESGTIRKNMAYLPGAYTIAIPLLCYEALEAEQMKRFLNPELDTTSLHISDDASTVFGPFFTRLDNGDEWASRKPKKSKKLESEIAGLERGSTDYYAKLHELYQLIGVGNCLADGSIKLTNSVLREYNVEETVAKMAFAFGRPDAFNRTTAEAPNYDTSWYNSFS